MSTPSTSESSSTSPSKLVAHLRDLHSGLLWLPRVVALRDAAVPDLEALLRGPSESIPHRRCLAADALAAIDTPLATTALTRSLRDASARSLPPMLQEAESTVVNRIAEHLGHYKKVEVTQALLEALSRRPYLQCTRALAAHKDSRAIPLVIRCLHDDVARPAAVESLRAFGEEAMISLVRTLGEPGSAAGEAPSHVDGRAASATLLGSLNGAMAERALIQALSDSQTHVRLAAALALIEHPDCIAAERVATLLVDSLGTVDWARANQISTSLVRLGTSAEEAVLRALVREPENQVERIGRLRAVGAAARLGMSSAIPILASLYRASDPNLRLASIGALARHPRTEPVILRRFLSDPVAVIRKKAMEALCARDSLSLDRTTELLGDEDERIRSLAQQRLRAYGSAALPALRRAAHGWGAPLHGLTTRWRMWSSACRLLATASTHATSNPLTAKHGQSHH
jgi:HEAT repeat protein